MKKILLSLVFLGLFTNTAKPAPVCISKDVAKAGTILGGIAGGVGTFGAAKLVEKILEKRGYIKSDEESRKNRRYVAWLAGAIGGITTATLIKLVCSQISPEAQARAGTRKHNGILLNKKYMIPATRNTYRFNKNMGDETLNDMLKEVNEAEALYLAAEEVGIDNLYKKICKTRRLKKDINSEIEKISQKTNPEVPAESEQ